MLAAPLLRGTPQDPGSGLTRPPTQGMVQCDAAGPPGPAGTAPQVCYALPADSMALTSKKGRWPNGGLEQSGLALQGIEALLQTTQPRSTLMVPSARVPK